MVAIDLVRSPSEAFPEPIGVTPVDEAPTRTPDAADPTFEEEVMELVNLERWNNGQLPPLKQNDFLDASSETHSNNMAVRDFVMHCDPDTGTLPWDRMIAAGHLYSSAGENIAWGYPDPQAVVGGWMATRRSGARSFHSPEHHYPNRSGFDRSRSRSRISVTEIATR